MAIILTGLATQNRRTSASARRYAVAPTCVLPSVTSKRTSGDAKGWLAAKAMLIKGSAVAAISAKEKIVWGWTEVRTGREASITPR
jgi:hypothetical protein